MRTAGTFSALARKACGALCAVVAVSVAVVSASAQETPPPAAEQPVVAGPGADQLRLQPGDAVRVTIWREDELSGEFPVDQSGRVTLPLLGDLRVSEIPVGALRDSLIVLYRQHVRSPSITVTPIRRINILGEVQRPGLFGVDPTITLAGAIGLAGGPTAQGDIRRVEVIRAGQPGRERVSTIETLDNVQLRSGDQIIVGRRSWFERNSGLVASAALTVTSILVTLLK